MKTPNVFMDSPAVISASQWLSSGNVIGWFLIFGIALTLLVAFAVFFHEPTDVGEKDYDKAVASSRMIAVVLVGVAALAIIAGERHLYGAIISIGTAEELVNEYREAVRGIVGTKGTSGAK